MIENLEVINFKSIKHLKIDCKKVNIFIGKPNTGKSNILEAIGLLSHITYGNLKDFVRLESMTNLFYDEDLGEKIIIKITENSCEITFKLKFENGRFIGEYNIIDSKGVKSGMDSVFIYDYNAYGDITRVNVFRDFKFYRFRIRGEFPSQESEFLLPPDGPNLLAILLTHKEIRKLVKQLFEEYGLRIVLKPQERKIEVQKEYEDIIISHPYPLISETLQRIIFHLIAIETNKNSIITFEEPESHAFPYYTKYLAERIALNKNNNQYFISTHNPYFLLSILEKTPQKDIAIHITYFKNYQTKIKTLTEEEKREILDQEIDIFFNIEKFLSEKE